MNIEWDRYIRNDKLADLELENLYDSSDEKERIEITKEFNKKGNKYCMPIIWAELIIKKGILQEKIILAKHWTTFSRHNEKENAIIENLVSSDNMLIRCAFYENPESMFFSFHEDQETIFKKLTHLERLALMRNPRVNRDLILKILDINNKDLDLNEENHKELIASFCTNKEYAENSKKHFYDDSFLDGMDAYFTTEIYPKIYDKAFEWIDKEPHITAKIYNAFSCEGKKKVEIYKKLKGNEDLTFVRIAIFESIPDRKGLRQEYSDLYKEGLSDSYDWIRLISASKYDRFDKNEVDILLKSNDVNLLEGLMRNESLSVECLKLMMDYLEQNDPKLMLPDVPAIEFKRQFREKCYKKMDDKKQDPFYFSEKEDANPNEDDLEKVSRETYKIVLNFHEYFTKYINERIEFLRKKINWIFWIILSIFFILLFKR